MGDYSFGLNQNTRSLSPVDLTQLASNQSLFSDQATSGIMMHDETLVEKAGQHQQLSPHMPNMPNGDHKVDHHLEEQFRKISPCPDVPNGIYDEKKPNSLTDVTNSLSQLGLSEPNSAVINSSAPSFWSTATADDTFVQGFQTLNGTVTFQNFPPASNQQAMFNTNMAPQGPTPAQLGLNVPQQQPPQRRAITGQHNNGYGPHTGFPQQQRQSSNPFLNNSKSYPAWSSAPHPQQQQSWSAVANQQPQQNQSPALNPWGNAQNVQQQRRSMPSMNPMAPNKKPVAPSMLISPTKFRKSMSFPGQMQPSAIGTKPALDFPGLDEHRDGGNMLGLPERQGNGYGDTMRFPSLESHLLDIMRTSGEPHDQFKGKSPFAFCEDQVFDDGLDQTVPNLNSPSRCSPNSQMALERIERFSRKVFVGGLPPDIDEEEITAAFRRFGPLVVDWPHKAESKSYFPPKGYCFLLFQDEISVQALIEACIVDDDKLYWCVSSPTMKDKPVQIRPWNLADADFVMDGSQPLDPRKTIFVGGVPRPLRAVELAMIMDRLYGGVCYAGIDTDPELKYPKGAGRVAFSNQQSYIAAISARFVQLQHGDIDKRVEVKPYVLDDQMCDECQGTRCGGKFAPFFCANVTCLQYYCEQCWAQIHSRPGREFHKPLVKEGADRPRTVPFRWC